MRNLEDEIEGYISIEKICKKYPFEFNKWKMGYLLRMRDKNGLEEILFNSKCKFYVKEEDFEKWRKNR